jgi:hypothetical protein
LPRPTSGALSARASAIQLTAALVGHPSADQSPRGMSADRQLIPQQREAAARGPPSSMSCRPK